MHKAIHLLTAEVVAAKKFEAFKIAKDTINTIMVLGTLLFAFAAYRCIHSF